MESLKQKVWELYCLRRKDKWTKTKTVRLLEAATSDDDMAAPLSMLRELADMSQWPSEVQVIAQFLTTAYRSPSEEWRRIYKALHLAEFLLANGSYSVTNALRDRSMEVRYLCDFVHAKEGFDRGESSKLQSVRTKARLLYSQLTEVNPHSDFQRPSNYDIEKGSCFAQGRSSGYMPPPLPTGGYDQSPPSTEPATLQQSGKKSFQPEVVYRQPAASPGLFDRLNKQKPKTDLFTAEKPAVKPVESDLLSFEALGGKKQASQDLIALDPVATQGTSALPVIPVLFAPAVQPESVPVQAVPPQPVAIAQKPVVQLPAMAAAVPQAKSQTPRITHNLAPAEEQPQFPLPSKPAPKQPVDFGLDALVSSLDNLREETEKTKSGPKKPDFVINI